MMIPIRSLVGCLALAGAAACCGCNGGAVDEVTADARAAEERGAPLDRVKVGQPQRKKLVLSTAQPGRIEAFEEAPLYARIGGYVESVPVDIGDRVREGDVMVKLWAPEAGDAVRQAAAFVKQAEAEVAQSDAMLTVARARIKTAAAAAEQAKAGVLRAQADHDRWQAELRRIEELAAGGSVTKKLAEETRQQLGAATAARQEVEANISAAKAGQSEADANVKKAEADVEAAQARLGVAQAQHAREQSLQNYLEIKAPFDGIVVRRHVDTGHLVQASAGSSAKPLLVVARMDKVRVFVDIPEAECPWITCGDDGDQAVVRVLALGREFAARLTRCSWSLGDANRSMRTQIDLDNAEQALRPGMFAMVRIQLEVRPDALVLPTSAIVQEGGESIACRVVSGRIERRKLQLGLRSGDEVEVLSGIAEHDSVVLTGARGLQEGQKVDVMAAPN